MATKSILKTICIQKEESAYALINAIENAKEKNEKKVEMSLSYSDATREEIRKLFGEENGCF